MSGSGLVTTFQELPFHDSITVSVSAPMLAKPTATQLEELMHDTPLNASYVVLGLGVVSTFQEVPFHDSARV